MGGGASSKVAAREFQALTRRRAERARELVSRYPASREALEFLAQVAGFQAGVDPGAPFDSLPALVELVRSNGPAALAEAASALDPDCLDAESFFSRVLAQPVRFGDPRCQHAPQAGLLKPLGHGHALWLSCAHCFHEWEYARNRCVACGQTDAKKLAYYKAEEIAHIQVMTCDECRQYIHLIDIEKEPRTVADMDEVVALPLDVWAIERGFSKVQPNLAGI